MNDDITVMNTVIVRLHVVVVPFPLSLQCTACVCPFFSSFLRILFTLHLGPLLPRIPVSYRGLSQYLGST